MLSIVQSFWIKDKYYDRVGFVPAKDCKFNKENLKKELEEELADKIEFITDIEEGYYRICKSGKDSYEYDEFGEYHYRPCEKGKGAVLYYYAGFIYKKYKEEEKNNDTV